MKKFGIFIYYNIGLILVYLALAALRSILSFLLRYWILLFALVAAVYITYRHCKSGDMPWWLVKIQRLFPRIRHRKD